MTRLRASSAVNGAWTASTLISIAPFAVSNATMGYVPAEFCAAAADAARHATIAAAGILIVQNL